MDPSKHPPIRPSAFASELSKLGLDPLNLKPLSELSRPQVFETMNWIAQSLGVECTHCHASEQDFTSETPNKQIARRMWNDFLVGRRLSSGPLFCDSCHQGRTRILQRPRRSDVAAYMKSEFGQILGADGASLTCPNCHTSPFQGHIFEQLWGIDRPPPALESAPAP